MRWQKPLLYLVAVLAIEAPTSADEAPAHAEQDQVGTCTRTMASGAGRRQFQTADLKFAIVTDLDKKSRDTKKFVWRATLQLGVLHVDQGDPSSDGCGFSRFRIEWQESRQLDSALAYRNRSMELSELVLYGGQLLAACDITGTVFEVDLHNGRSVPRWILTDGDGSSQKPFKSEWATVKDGTLLIGSMGREWVRDDGSIEHFNNQWVKSIDGHGRSGSLNWRDAYEKLRLVTNTSSPGYLWHEAVDWDPTKRRWVILPRKASELEPYSPEADERRGTNFLLLASEDFSDIEVKTIGPLEEEYGFSAVRRVPGMDDVYMALKVKELGDVTETKITVFDLHGNFLLDPPFQLVGGLKYEGLTFIDRA